MAEVVLAAEVGRPIGSRAVRRLRREGKVPGVIYGHGTDALPIAVVRLLARLDKHGIAAHLTEAVRSVVLPASYRGVSGGAQSGERAHGRVLRDEWEIALTRAALHRDLPLLAICRGLQVLNVALGGTLHQHLPDVVGHGRHDGPPNGFGLHQVRISPDSTLAGILPQEPEDGFLDVPTHHHQAVDLLGDGLKAVAWEEDGTIEAVEAGPSELDGLSGFVLGVQWHPEQGSDPRLFTALVRAAMDRASAGRAAVGRDAAGRDVIGRDVAGRDVASRATAGRASGRSAVLAPMI